MKTRVVVCVIVAAALAISAEAASCTVSASMAFGPYASILSEARDTIGDLSVVCTGTANEQVTVTISANLGGGTFSARTLSSGSSTLTYTLYTDLAHTLLWGDGTSGSNVISGTFNLDSTGNANEAYNFYGHIPAGQSLAKVGSYSDMLTVSMSY